MSKREFVEVEIPIEFLEEFCIKAIEEMLNN